jgi:hypothetical protein
MRTDIYSPDHLEVAPVAPVAPASACHPKIGATGASTGNAVAPAKSLAAKGRSQRGHRGHLRSKDHGNPVSSNRGRVSRSILNKEMAPVAPVASPLISQWVSRGHLDFAGGPGGPGHHRARAPPDLMT